MEGLKIKFETNPKLCEVLLKRAWGKKKTFKNYYSNRSIGDDSFTYNILYTQTTHLYKKMSIQQTNTVLIINKIHITNWNKTGYLKYHFSK